MNYTSVEIGKRIGITSNTVRTWADRFKPHMSEGAISSARRFDDDDLRVMATIADYRNQGLNLDEIDSLLADGKRIDTLPPERNAAEESAKADVQLVPREQVYRALDEVKRLTDERDRLMVERDNALESTEGLNTRINALEREIGLLQGELRVIQTERRPASYWLGIMAVAVLAVIVLAALVILLVLSV